MTAYFEVITNAVTGEVTTRPYTEAEIKKMEAQEVSSAITGVREQRNKLLSKSDWTQLPDAPVDQAAWAGYRQELRDLTEQVGFPTEVIWPTAPQ